MSEFLQKLKEQISRLKEQRPAYKEILNFYEKIVEEQKRIRPSINITPPKIKDDLSALQMKEGFPLLNKEDFPLDLASSIKLFQSLCQIGKEATSMMREDVQKIEDAIKDGKLYLDELLRKHSNPDYQNKIIEEMKFNRMILNYFIHMSIQPSIHANVEKLKGHVDLKNWLKGYCPICGSYPQMSLLKGEGQRFYLCSFCGFEWPGERLKCPFCENKEHESLHYYFVDGQKTYRIYTCDKCKQYIKTIDARELDHEPDLTLEDITTVHLDILASKNGFKKPTPSPWAS